MHGRYGVASSVEELIAQRGKGGPVRPVPWGRVRTNQAGPFGSAYRGRGMEFEESRSYQAGDDVRCIDWRVTARTGKVHTKLFQEERERPKLGIDAFLAAVSGHYRELHRGYQIAIAKR